MNAARTHDDCAVQNKARAAQVLSFFFVVSLITPPLAIVVAPGTRRFAHEPVVVFSKELRRASFPRAAEKVLAKAFGLRRYLVSGYSFIAYAVLGQSSNPQVLVGRDGWLFLDDARARAARRGRALYSKDELMKRVTELRKLRDLLSTWGGRLLVTVPPEKATIYPEFLPIGFPLPPVYTRVDQLGEALARAEIPFVDLRPALRAAKASMQVYDRFDTHWTAKGAAWALGVLKPALAALLGRDDLPPHETGLLFVPTREPGDLLRMLGLDGIYPRHERDQLALSSGSADLLSPRGPLRALLPHEQRELVFECANNSKLPSAVIFRDSFAMELAPVLSAAFRRSVWLWQRELDLDRVRKERPDLVLVEVTERVLYPDE